MQRKDDDPCHQGDRYKKETPNHNINELNNNNNINELKNNNRYLTARDLVRLLGS